MRPRRHRRTGSTPATARRRTSMTSETTVHDVIIIGSGPSGYTAAIYAARANLSPLVFEGAVTAGGALMNTTEVENFPGFQDGIMGPALMDEMRAQAERFGAVFVTDDVTDVSLTGDVKEVTDGEGGRHRARTVILATGSGYRKLGIADEERLWPRCLLVRDLRRLLLPRQGDRGRRRRGLGDRGGHLPHPLREEGLPRPPPRRAARLEDHAGAGLRRREAGDGLEQHRHLVARPGQAHRRDAERHRHRRDP